VRLLNAAADIVRDEFAQGFIFHRDIALGTQEIAKLPLHGAER
jgi:hypothetical protein